MEPILRVRFSQTFVIFIQLYIHFTLSNSQYFKHFKPYVMFATYSVYQSQYNTRNVDYNNTKTFTVNLRLSLCARLFSSKIRSYFLKHFL